MTTFNVIFTGGTAPRLLPFPLSLLQSPAVQIRLVANGCPPEEIELMRAVAGREERLSHHVLPFERTADHGLALNELFERFPEPHFAFADSDVIASGDFMAGLSPFEPGQAGVFAAPKAWMTDAERLGDPAAVLLGNRSQVLPDGSYVGSSYCAIYDRDALEPAWRAAPRGFRFHHGYQVPRRLMKALRARGWRYRWFDTGRFVNLMLLLAGYELADRPVGELHHIGELSSVDQGPSHGLGRRAQAIVRAGPNGRPLRRIADGVAIRRHTRRRRPASRALMKRRRDAVCVHLDEVLDAIAAGRPLPPAPRTDSPEVDRRIADLVATLETQYPRGLATLRQVSATMPTGPVAA